MLWSEDYKITFAFDEDHVTDKVRHAAVHAMAPGAVEENRLAGRMRSEHLQEVPEHDR